MGLKEGFERFQYVLSKSHRIMLDSSILIYHLEDVQSYSNLTEVLFETLARGNLEGVLSTISITELLTKPFADRKFDQVQAFESFIFSIPNVLLVPPNYKISKEAARLRGKYRFRTPDAILLSTALTEKADSFLTNDSNFRKAKSEKIAIIVLDDHTTT